MPSGIDFHLVSPMRAASGLTVPLLLLAAALVIPMAAAQESTAYEISGRVLDDAGNPLEGVRVSGNTYHEDRTRSSANAYDDDITDSEGRYTLHLAAGKGYINVYHEEWRRHDGREVQIDGPRSDLDFTLVAPPPKTARIEGVVTGADGKPIEGAEVTLQTICCMPDEGAMTPRFDGEGTDSSDAMTKPAIAPVYYHDDYAVTRTDAQGRFSFDAYPGQKQIMAWAKGHAQTSIQVKAEANKTETADIKLDKVPDRTAILEGRIADAKTGLPLQNVQVGVRSLEWGRYAYATTDRDGRYSIKTVPGWSEITVSFSGYGIPEPVAIAESGDKIAPPRELVQQYYPHHAVVKLASGDNDGDIDLAPKPKPTIALVGYVVDPDAKKGVEGARVNVWSHDGGDWGEAVTDATGSFKILVRSGHYTVSAWKEGHLSGSQTFVVGDAPSQRQDVVLPKGIMRWAPCDGSEDCGGPVMYADTAAKAEGGFALTPVPAMAARDAPQAASAESPAGANAASGPDTSRTATFSGSGGGLPPYDPEETASVPAAERGEVVSEVPSAGALLALLALAGVAALVARRKD